MGPTRVNRKLSFESGEEQIKGYGKVTQNTEIFSTKYGNNILEVGSPATSGSCSSRYSIHWSSRLCAVLLITGVSVFMLLMASLWHLTVLRYVSRYISYCDLCIEIRIVSWGTRIITPLNFIWVIDKFISWGVTYIRGLTVSCVHNRVCYPAAFAGATTLVPCHEV